MITEASMALLSSATVLSPVDSMAIDGLSLLVSYETRRLAHLFLQTLSQARNLHSD